MYDIINISKSDVSFLKFTSPGNFYPRSLSSSEEGFLAILHCDSIVIGTIGFQPSSEDKKYILNQESVEIDFKNTEPILNITDFKFDESINTNKIPDEKIYQLTLSENFTMSDNDERRSKTFSRIDWSPLDTLVNKSYLALMRFDGRIVILGQNKISNVWEKEYDMLNLYQNFYKNNLLTCPIDENGFISCINADQFIHLKDDLKLISFSWSCLVRQTKQNQYCLIAFLSESGILTIWQLINDQISSSCVVVYSCRLDSNKYKPKTIQFCDISNDSFLLTVLNFDNRIIALPFLIGSSPLTNEIIITRNQDIILNNNKSVYLQANKSLWSVKYSTLIVGYSMELLFAKLDISNENNFICSLQWLELPTPEEISGIVIKQNIVYVTAKEGHLFGIKLDNNPDNIEMNEIVFDIAEFNTNTEFLDVFVSPNGVHLGFLKINGDKSVKPEKSQNMVDIALISMMPEKELLNILMDDNKPFSRKQDAVEEMRHLYVNNKHLMHVALQKLVKAESQWDGSTLHHLQLTRYLCILFGYQLNINHELSDQANKHLDFSKIRNLESIIISRNISYWLDGFSDLNTSEINKDDCLFVVSLCAKLQMANVNEDINEAIEAALNKAKSLLGNEFGVDERTIEKYECECRQLICPVCDKDCTFNIFASKCASGHIMPRCCKSLDICTNDVKKCTMCGSIEKCVNSAGLSIWRLEIINSNCPLCDGKFVKLQF